MGKPGFKGILSAAVLAALLVYGPAARAGEPDLEGPGRVLRQLKIEKVDFNKDLGLYEITVAGNTQPLYMTRDYRYVIIGQVIDVANRRNLTEERTRKTRKIDFARLPLDKAVKISEGAKKMAVFLDPDCPWSRKLYGELKQLNDVSVYIFLYPLIDLHPKARDNSITAWCSEDKHGTLDGLFSGSPGGTEKRECPHPVDSNIALAAENNFSGTPTIVLDTGEVIDGYLTAPQLMSRIRGD